MPENYSFNSNGVNYSLQKNIGPLLELPKISGIGLVGNAPMPYVPTLAGSQNLMNVPQ
jgi:hypothetical protein